MMRDDMMPVIWGMGLLQIMRLVVIALGIAALIRHLGFSATNETIPTKKSLSITPTLRFPP